MELPELRSLAIIGSGLAGLTVAHKARESGLDVTVFEKSRGPGGRLSSKRVQPDQTVDMGAQFFTVRTPQFRTFLEQAVGGTHYDVWDAHLLYESQPGVDAPFHEQTRYVGIPRMTAISRALADPLDVVAESRVIQVWREEQGWMLARQGETTAGPFDGLVITAPPEQARELLAGNEPAQHQLAPFSMLPCWALALCFEQPLELGFDGIQLKHPVLGWVACNSTKPGRDSSAGHWWVIHANSQWSADHAQREPNEIGAAMLKSFQDRFGVAAEPSQMLTHRWLYARPDSNNGEPGCLSLLDQRLGLCGDWLAGGRVEGAFSSAMALLEAWGISREAGSGVDRNG